MRTILIVDDDEALAGMYQTMLEQKNFRVVIAKDGAEGLVKAQEEKPALILTDILMPVMDGFQMMAKLKSNPALKDIPVIVLSNLSGKPDMERARELGAAQYLIKNTNLPKQVVQIVEDILGKTEQDNTL
jgi:two-component system alkaline phosphatase synthesis response regulator PhoP